VRLNDFKPTKLLTDDKQFLVTLKPLEALPFLALWCLRLVVKQRLV
jgi:hypothetical protein